MRWHQECAGCLRLTIDEMDQQKNSVITTVHESLAPLGVLHLARTGITLPAATRIAQNSTQKTVEVGKFPRTVSCTEIQCLGSWSNTMASVLMLLDSSHNGLGGDTDTRQLNKSGSGEGQHVGFQLQIDPGLIEQSALPWQRWSPRIGRG